MKPTSDQAFQFALMLKAGLPASDAIRYFTDEQDSLIVSQLLRDWRESRAVREAQLKLMGKSWQNMSLDEQISAGLNQQYSSMAYLCFSCNYIEASASDKAKLDTARVALEAKQAGTSGQANPIEQFFADIKAGKVVLPKVVAPKPN